MSFAGRDYQCIKVHAEGHTAILQFNRPDSFNKATPDLVDEYYDALLRIYLDEKIKVVIITGNDNAYCAGGKCKIKDDVHGGYNSRASELYSLRQSSPKVQIAMIAGYCIGAGFQNAMSCDLRIAADNARFALPPKKSDWPREARIRWHCQSDQGRLSMLEGIFEADAAYNMGFVNMVVPLKTLKDTTMGIARVVAEKPDFFSLGQRVI